MTTLNTTKVVMMREMREFVETTAAKKKVALPEEVKDMFVRFLAIDLINGDSESELTLKLSNLIKTYKITARV